MTFADGTSERYNIPAEIWRRNNDYVTKLLISDKQLTSVVFDPDHQTADVDVSDNAFPRRITKSRLELYKWPDETRNLMKGMMAELEDETNKKAVPLNAK